MKTFRIAINSFEIEYDTEYGCDKRKGWTIVEKRCVVVDLEPSLFKAVWVWLKKRKML